MILEFIFLIFFTINMETNFRGKKITIFVFRRIIFKIYELSKLMRRRHFSTIYIYIH